ncbi:unnamed protein product [Ixodes persulcatus]
MAGQSNLQKKQGVSGESATCRTLILEIDVSHHPKDFRSAQLIKDAIMENDFLKNLDSSQVREVVDCMYPQVFEAGTLVIRERDVGSHLYVSAEGELEVEKEDRVLGRMGPGKAFGELAILYNCTRTASVKAVTKAKVWVLDRRVFQAIMMKTGLQRQEENIQFLRSVPLLQTLSNEVLAKMSDVLEVDFYPAGVYIIRQGTSGDTFFIISHGSVKVTKRIEGTNQEEEIRILNRGDYFGEQALLRRVDTEDKRTANVVSLDPGVECLALDRDSFIQLIGDLRELQDKHYDDRLQLRPPQSKALEVDSEVKPIQLDDLEVLATLGIGGFGRVELVQYVQDRSRTFALKCLTKKHIVETQQQEHVLSEKALMMSCRHPFICRMFKTFRDEKYVYMLMEACLGGEVWSLLRDRRGALSTRAPAGSTRAACWKPCSTCTTRASCTGTSSPRTWYSTRSDTPSWLTSASRSVCRRARKRGPSAAPPNTWLRRSCSTRDTTAPSTSGPWACSCSSCWPARHRSPQTTP